MMSSRLLIAWELEQSAVLGKKYVLMRFFSHLPLKIKTNISGFKFSMIKITQINMLYINIDKKL